MEVKLYKNKPKEAGWYICKRRNLFGHFQTELANIQHPLYSLNPDFEYVGGGGIMRLKDIKGALWSKKLEIK